MYPATYLRLYEGKCGSTARTILYDKVLELDLASNTTSIGFNDDLVLVVNKKTSSHDIDL